MLTSLSVHVVACRQSFSVGKTRMWIMQVLMQMPRWTTISRALLVRTLRTVTLQIDRQHRQATALYMHLYHTPLHASQNKIHATEHQVGSR